MGEGKGPSRYNAIACLAMSKLRKTPSQPDAPPIVRLRQSAYLLLRVACINGYCGGTERSEQGNGVVLLPRYSTRLATNKVARSNWGSDLYSEQK